MKTIFLLLVSVLCLQICHGQICLGMKKREVKKLMKEQGAQLYSNRPDAQLTYFLKDTLMPLTGFTFNDQDICYQQRILYLSEATPTILVSMNEEPDGALDFSRTYALKMDNIIFSVSYTESFDGKVIRAFAKIIE